MKTLRTIVLSISAGVAVGAAAVQALHAQAEPPAYVVAEIDVANLEPFDKEYVPPAARASPGHIKSAIASAERLANRARGRNEARSITSCLLGSR